MNKEEAIKWLNDVEGLISSAATEVDAVDRIKHYAATGDFTASCSPQKGIFFIASHFCCSCGHATKEEHEKAVAQSR